MFTFTHCRGKLVLFCNPDMCSTSNYTTITNFAVFLMQTKTSNLAVVMELALNTCQNCILDGCSSGYSVLVLFTSKLGE